MNQTINAWSVLRKLFWQDALLILCVFTLARVTAFIIQRLILRLAEKIPPRFRLSALRTLPVTRLLIGIGAVTVIVPVLVEPTFRNIVTLVASVGLALAFALKDYG